MVYEDARKKVNQWWNRLWNRSLHIITWEREGLMERGLNPKDCVLVDRGEDGTSVFVWVRLVGPIIIKKPKR